MNTSPHDRPMYNREPDDTPVRGAHVRPEHYAYEQPPQQPYGYQPPPPRLPAPYYAEGQPQPYQVAPKSPPLHLLASFFIPGLGSMLTGHGGKGALILVLYIVGLITTVFIVGIFLAIAMWIWGLVAGYQDAVAWNRARGIIS